MARANEESLPGLPRNFLRPCMLLLIGEQPSYGYDLLERIRGLGLKRAEPGMVYRALRAMEQEGLVRSSWQDSKVGPPRRTYELSDKGKGWLHAWADELGETRRILGEFLGRYEEFAPEKCGLGRRTRVSRRRAKTWTQWKRSPRFPGM